MLIEFHPNPNKPIRQKNVFDLSPNAPPLMQLGPPASSGERYHPTYYEFQAKKKNCTVAEYKRRDEIVRAMVREINYMKGDVVYPWSIKDYEEKGKCYIKGIYHTYAEMEGEWPIHDRPFVVTAHPMSLPGEVFFATGGYFSKFAPTE